MKEVEELPEILADKLKSLAVWLDAGALFLLESSLRNWNDGKTIANIAFHKNYENLSNEKFYFPAMWHAQHLLSVLKQHPLAASL